MGGVTEEDPSQEARILEQGPVTDQPPSSTAASSSPRALEFSFEFIGMYGAGDSLKPAGRSRLTVVSSILLNLGT